MLKSRENDLIKTDMFLAAGGGAAAGETGGGERGDQPGVPEPGPGAGGRLAGQHRRLPRARHPHPHPPLLRSAARRTRQMNRHLSGCFRVFPLPAQHPRLPGLAGPGLLRAVRVRGDDAGGVRGGADQAGQCCRQIQIADFALMRARLNTLIN